MSDTLIGTAIMVTILFIPVCFIGYIIHEELGDSTELTWLGWIIWRATSPFSKILKTVKRLFIRDKEGE